MHRNIDTFSQSDEPVKKVSRELCTGCAIPMHIAYQVYLHEDTGVAALNP